MRCGGVGRLVRVEPFAINLVVDLELLLAIVDSLLFSWCNLDRPVGLVCGSSKSGVLVAVPVCIVWTLQPQLVIVVEGIRRDASPLASALSVVSIVLQVAQAVDLLTEGRIVAQES